MESSNFKTGDILFTSRKPKLSKPKTYVAFFINLLQTKKLRNLDQTPTHTGQIIFIYGKAHVIDSDTRGVVIYTYENWIKGRNFVKVFRPNIINGLPTTQLYTDRLISKSGGLYGWKSIPSFIEYLAGKRYLGRLTTDSDDMICSVFTAWGYKEFIKDWQIQTPQSLWVNRFKNFPKGEDI